MRELISPILAMSACWSGAVTPSGTLSCLSPARLSRGSSSPSSLPPRSSPIFISISVSWPSCFLLTTFYKKVEEWFWNFHYRQNDDLCTWCDSIKNFLLETTSILRWENVINKIKFKFAAYFVTLLLLLERMYSTEIMKRIRSRSFTRVNM